MPICLIQTIFNECKPHAHPYNPHMYNDLHLVPSRQPPTLASAVVDEQKTAKHFTKCKLLCSFRICSSFMRQCPRIHLSASLSLPHLVVW